jgi:hypothetical protein
MKWITPKICKEANFLGFGVVYNGKSVGTDDTCPQGSLSLLEHKVDVAVRLADMRIIEEIQYQMTARETHQLYRQVV